MRCDHVERSVIPAMRACPLVASKGPYSPSGRGSAQPPGGARYNDGVTSAFDSGSESARPFIVAGMHRSGTSMVAGILAKGGIAMGRELLSGDAANPAGYFEDIAFLELQRGL